MIIIRTIMSFTIQFTIKVVAKTIRCNYFFFCNIIRSKVFISFIKMFEFLDKISKRMKNQFLHFDHLY